MCGQAGIHRRTDKPLARMNALADALLVANEIRGTDAAGFLAVLDDGKVQVKKSTSPAGEFVVDRPAFNEDARTVLLHTRYATRGSRYDVRNAHPVISGRCAAVHNGTIYNDDELFDAFKLPRKAEVDSEVIPALVDHAGWENAEHAIEMLRGGAATAIVSVDHPRQVILAKTRDYPMHYLVTEDVVVWASTRAAIEFAWKVVYGEAPVGTFHSLAEWTMLRVNGKLDLIQLDRPLAPKPVKTPKKADRPGRRVAAPKAKAKKATKTGTSKSARKRRGGRKAVPTAASVRNGVVHIATPTIATPPFEREPWMDEVVHDLMRTDGLSLDEAQEAVYGFALDEILDGAAEELDWRERLWADVDLDLAAAAVLLD